LTVVDSANITLDHQTTGATQYLKSPGFDPNPHH